MEIIKVYNTTVSDWSKYKFEYSQNTLDLVPNVLLALIQHDYLKSSPKEDEQHTNLLVTFIKSLFKDYLTKVEYQDEYLKSLDGHRMFILAKDEAHITLHMITLDYNVSYSHRLNYKVKLVEVDHIDHYIFKQLFRLEEN